MKLPLLQLLYNNCYLLQSGDELTKKKALRTKNKRSQQIFHESSFTTLMNFQNKVEVSHLFAVIALPNALTHLQAINDLKYHFTKQVKTRGTNKTVRF